MRVIVCGGRNYKDRHTVYAHLATWMLPSAEFDGLLWDLRDAARDGNLTIVHGGATGADTFAGEAASELGLSVEVFPAQWGEHGKAAGPIRNQQMLDAGADLVVAFPGGRGTAHMVGAARKAGVPVLEVPATSREVGA